MSPTSPALSPQSWRVGEQGALPAPHPSLPMPQSQLGAATPVEQEDVSLVGLRKALWQVLEWEDDAPSRQRLGVPAERSLLLQVLHWYSAGVGLLHAVELFLFLKKPVLLNVLTSNLESLSSSFQEKLANPP